MINIDRKELEIYRDMIDPGSAVNQRAIETLWVKIQQLMQERDEALSATTYEQNTLVQIMDAKDKVVSMLAQSEEKRKHLEAALLECSDELSQRRVEATAAQVAYTDLLNERNILRSKVELLRNEERDNWPSSSNQKERLILTLAELAISQSTVIINYEKSNRQSWADR